MFRIEGSKVVWYRNGELCMLGILEYPRDCASPLLLPLLALQYITAAT